jgi:hypothetical protein
MTKLQALTIAILTLFLFNLVSADPLPMNIISIDVDSENIYALAYTASAGARLRVYDKETYEFVTEIDISGDIPSYIEVVGDKLYVGSHDGKVYFFSLQPEISLSNVFGEDLDPSILRMDVDDEHIFIHKTLGNTEVRSLSDFSLVTELENTTLDTGGLFMFESDNDFLYGSRFELSTKSSRLYVWDKSDWSQSTLEIASSMAEQGNVVYIMALHVDDSFLYTSSSESLYANAGVTSYGSFIEIWNKSDLSVYSNLTLSQDLEEVNFLTSDSRYLYTSLSTSGQVKVYTKPDLELVSEMVYDPFELTGSVVVSDGKLFVSTLNGTISVWDTSDFSLIHVIGEPIENLISSTGVDLDLPETFIDPLPLLLSLIVVLIINALLPDKTYERFKKRFEEVSMNDILIIVLVAGVILLVVAVMNPRFVSYKFSNYAEPASYFNIFVRNSSIGYYWFGLWSVVGYWLSRKRGRKVASVISIAFLLIAYLLFVYIPS